MRRTSNSAAGAGGRGQAWLQPGRTYTVVIAIASGAEQPAPSTADRATAFATEQAPTRGCLSQPQQTRSGSAADLPAECSFPMDATPPRRCRRAQVTVRVRWRFHSCIGDELGTANDHLGRVRTSTLQTTRSTSGFPRGERRDSNPRPPGPQLGRRPSISRRNAALGRAGTPSSPPQTRGFWGWETCHPQNSPPLQRHPHRSIQLSTLPRRSLVPSELAETAASMGKRHSASGWAALLHLAQASTRSARGSVRTAGRPAGQR